MIALDALGRVVGAHVPLDGQGEHLGQQRHHPVRLIGGGLHAPVQLVDVGKSHVGDLEFAELRENAGVDHSPVVLLTGGAFLDGVFLEVALGEVLDGGGTPVRVAVSHRVLVTVDSLLEFPGLRAGRLHRTVRVRPDGVAAFAAAGTVVDDEGLGAGGSDPAPRTPL